jgi:O-antigen/teichoic acid export membrane protein
LPDSLPEIRFEPSSGTFEALPPAPASGVVKSGVFWIGACFGVMQLTRFGSQVVLSHWLDREAFGLISLTFVFVVGLHLFSDLGIRISIIQSPRGEDPDFLNTAWTIQIIRGAGVWILAVAIAWPVAFWRPQPEPALLWLLPVVGFASVIEGFTSTKLYGLHRHLQQRKIVLIDLFSSLGGTAVTITWAYFDRSILAMAIGALASSMIQMVLSHLLPGPRNRFRRDPACTRELIHFGRWIFLSTVFTFLADQSDRLVVGYMSMATLGVYHIANQIAMVPVTLMGTVARQLIMPLFSRLIDAGKDLQEVLATIQVRAGAATSLLIAGLVAVGPTLILCLYDKKFQDARWILPLLATVMLIQILDANASALLFARGKPRTYALSNGIKVVCLAAFMPIGVWTGRQFPNPDRGGLTGLIAAIILGELGRYLCTGIALRRDGLPIFRRDVGWAAFALTLGVSAHYLVNEFAPSAPVAGRKWPTLLVLMLLEGCLVVACWSALVAFGWKAGWFRDPTKAPQRPPDKQVD